MNTPNDQGSAVKYQNILDNERKLEEVHDKIRYGNWFYRLFVIGTLKIELNKLKIKRHRLIDDYLLASDPEFKRLVNENYSCLNAHLKFKVYAESFSTGSYSKSMCGSIHRNGYCYLETKRTNGILNAEPYAFPKIMKGKVNYIGEVYVETVKTDSSLLFSAPLELEGQIGQNGAIELMTTKTSLEVNKNMVIGKMIGQMIGDEDKLDVFFTNAAKIKAIREAFEKQLEDLSL